MAVAKEILQLLIERASRLEVETGVKANRALVSLKSFEELAWGAIGWCRGHRPPQITIRGILVEPAFVSSEQEPLVWAERVGISPTMATKLYIEIDESTLRKLVLDHLSAQLGCALSEKDVFIEVKSKQNYKSEWERAEFRARVERTQD